MRRSFEVFADYHQVLLLADPATHGIETFTDLDCRRRLVQGLGVVTMMTERNMDVRVSLDVLAAPPLLDLAAGDHIAEASLDLVHGRICARGLMDQEWEEIRVTPGPYRIRLVGSGYASVDGLEGDDRYDLTLWPAPMGEVAVLKQWEG